MHIPGLPVSDAPQSVDAIICDTLHSVRTLLGMQVAFVSEFSDGRRIFRHVDSQPDFAPIQVGGSDPLEESYCQRVVDGRLPELLKDATLNAEALKLPVTTALPVGAHLSIPIRFSNGHVYGTFCCFSAHPDRTLNQRDLGTMRLFADFVSKILERESAATAGRNEITARLRTVLDGRRFTVFYQPIVNVVENKTVGYEALARFLAEPVRTPDIWFNEAFDVGLQEELELAVIEKALEGLAHFPEDTYLSLNTSPETILKGAIGTILADYPLERLTLEVTEHAFINDYASIATALAPLKKRGLRLSVDDAGAGYASFRHILKLKPDVIKLDISLIQKIDVDTGSRALAAALARFAEETGSQIVAEGVEFNAELQILRELNIHRVQGFLLGRPKPLEQHLN